MAEAPHRNQLTPQQETAIDLILTGKNDREVAQTIGKSRSTVINRGKLIIGAGRCGFQPWSRGTSR